MRATIMLSSLMLFKWVEGCVHYLRHSNHCLWFDIGGTVLTFADRSESALGSFYVRD